MISIRNVRRKVNQPVPKIAGKMLSHPISRLYHLDYHLLFAR